MRSGSVILITILLALAGSAPSVPGQSALLFEEKVRVPERGLVEGHALLVDGEKFRFLPPAEWLVASRVNRNSFSLTSLDLASTMTVSFRRRTPEELEPVSMESGRLWAGEKFGECGIIREQRCFTGDSPGVLFDLETKEQGRMDVMRRVVWAASGEWIFEFVLAAPRLDFESRADAFRFFVGSFHGAGGLAEPEG